MMFNSSLVTPSRAADAEARAAVDVRSLLGMVARAAWAFLCVGALVSLSSGCTKSEALRALETSLSARPGGDDDQDDDVRSDDDLGGEADAGDAGRGPVGDETDAAIDAGDGGRDAGTDKPDPDVATCSNGVLDGDETSEGCGGSCPPCDDGATCTVNADCLSEVCDGVCQVPVCDDDVKNGAELGKDCGGPCDRGCPEGTRCEGAADCASLNCADQLCAGDSCSDGKLNGDEVDVDCGGSCDPCADGQRCEEGAGCASEYCSQTTYRCRPQHCRNNDPGDETSMNCGGSCDPCDAGEACQRAEDCGSGICLDNTCDRAGCFDGVQNSSETDVDCGGEICRTRCAVGDGCTVDGDCETFVCHELLCVAADASCSDLRKNGAETAADCGGPDCLPCGFGEACTGGTDCTTGLCDATCQMGPTGTACAATSDCISGRCAEGRCEPALAGISCVVGSDCESGSCEADGTCAPSHVGEACAADDDCLSQVCEGVQCARGYSGAHCESALECQSERCSMVAPSQGCLPGAFGTGCKASADCVSGNCLPDGTCGARRGPGACLVAADCSTAQCDAATCRTSGAGEPCAVGADCLSGTCTAGACAASARGGECRDDGDCANDNCRDSVCFETGAGNECSTNADCYSRDCRAGICALGASGTFCTGAADCVSGACSSGACGAFGVQYSDTCSLTTTNNPRVYGKLVNGTGRAFPYSDVGIIFYTSPEQPLTDVRIYNASKSMGREIIDNGALIRLFFYTGENFPVGQSFTFDFDYYNGPNWPVYDTTNDFSAQTCGDPNPRVPVCARVGGQWYQVAGQRAPGDALGCQRF